MQTPFDVKVTDWESVSVERFTGVVHSQGIDPARFTPPAGK
jgi:hypothetical protein